MEIRGTPTGLLQLGGEEKGEEKGGHSDDTRNISEAGLEGNQEHKNPWKRMTTLMAVPRAMQEWGCRLQSHLGVGFVGSRAT